MKEKTNNPTSKSLLERLTRIETKQEILAKEIENIQGNHLTKIYDKLDSLEEKFGTFEKTIIQVQLDVSERFSGQRAWLIGVLIALILNLLIQIFR